MFARFSARSTYLDAWAGEARSREGNPMLDLYVDADACPVKDEIYRGR